MPRNAHIGVMITGNDHDLVRRTKGLKPLACSHKLWRQGKIDEVTAHQDLPGIVVLYVRDDEIEDRAVMNKSPSSLPVGISKGPLAEQGRERNGFGKRKMRIRKMRDHCPLA